MNHIIFTPKREKAKISKYIYGQFAEHLGKCIYEGLWVGENSDIPNKNGIRTDVVEALKEINVPVLRWPGGLFADEYHWKDGIGPREKRKKIVNSNWGGTVENNHFGTHEYFELCKQLGTETYINGNVGSGTVQEMQEWIDYMTFPGESPMANLRKENGQEEGWNVDFFGVGNESWGGGGNMRPEYYADLYRQYQTFVRNYTDRKIYKIACGANIDDYNWTEVLMKNAAPFMDGLSLHHYALASEWEDKRPATGFPDEEWFSLIHSAYKMDEFITKHSTIMDKYDPEKRIGLIVDEWGTWLAVEEGTNPGFLYQQNTIRDAMIASITLNIFHKHADRVQMANIAQMVNVLQSMILTDGEKMIKTPTYHVFDMYQNHQDASLIDAVGETSDTISYTASIKEKTLTVSLCNYSITDEEEIVLEVNNESFGNIEAWVLAAKTTDAHNTFETPDNVQKEIYKGYSINESKLTLKMPPMSVVTIVAKN